MSTAENQPNNHKYIHWGGPIDNPSTNITRLLFLNINGVGTTNLSNGFFLLHHHMQKLQVNIASYVETNVDWKQYWIKKLNEQQGQEFFTNMTYAYSCHSWIPERAHQPGGTMMAVNGTLAMRHLESGSDPTNMGRYKKFVGKNGKRIIFITAYRVCIQSIEHAGPKTSFFHQWHSLRKVGYEKPHPRKQLPDDLETLVQQSIGDGCDICVSLDANEELESRSGQLKDWVSDCSLVSTHEHFSDEEYYVQHKIPGTCKGKEKIDHVLCTPRLFSCIVNVAIKPAKEGTVTNHRALIVDFNTDKLLGSASAIAKPSTRILQSTKQQSSPNYRIELDNYLTVQNIYARASKIIKTYEQTGTLLPIMEKHAETLDKYITTCMLKSEQHILGVQN